MTPGTAALVDVACGRRPADLYIANGRVLNVYSGELLRDVGIAVISGRVAYVGPCRSMIGSETHVLDAEDGILTPGYIDPHAHFDLIVSMAALAETVLPLGTTTVINDTLAIAVRFGAAGLEYLRAAAEGLPLHVYYMTTPTGVAPELEEQGYPAGMRLTDADLTQALSDRRVLGTGEMPSWRRLLAGDPEALRRLHLTKRRGKRCAGHTPGAKGGQVQALAAAGLTDCHESLTADEALERLRAGLYVILRHGAARSDLPALAPLARQEGVDRSRLMLTPDWMPPGDLRKSGHMDHVIATALGQGLAPLDVYRMATLNPARYLRIEDQVGAIAPGRHADILCLESLLQPRPHWVVARGTMVAREGRMVADWHRSGSEPQLPPYQPPVIKAAAADFRIPFNGRSEVLVPAIELVDRTVTRRVDLRLPVKDGAVVPWAGSGEVVKMAMPRPQGGFAVGFLIGIGAPLGGLSSSVASSPYHTLVLGSRDEDMALAYNRMVSLGGGVVAAQHGRIEAELPLPVGGFIANAPLPDVAAGIEKINQWARDLGSPLEDLFLIQRYFTYTGVPFFRFTPWGIYDIKERIFLPPVVE